MKKKLICIVAILLFTLSLSACQSEDNSYNKGLEEGYSKALSDLSNMEYKFYDKEITDEILFKHLDDAEAEKIVDDIIQSQGANDSSWLAENLHHSE